MLNNFGGFLQGVAESPDLIRLPKVIKMLLKQVKVLEPPAPPQSSSLPVAMVLRASSVTCGKPPAAAFHHTARNAAFVLPQLLC